MDRINQINELFAGELSDSETAELFSAMAGDDKLRKVFQNFTKVDNTIKQNREFRTPPPALKTAIFKQAGMKIPASAQSGVGLIGMLFSKKGLIVSNIIALSLVAFLLIRSVGMQNETIEMANNDACDDAINCNKSVMQLTVPRETIAINKESIVQYSEPVKLHNTNNTNNQAQTTPAKIDNNLFASIANSNIASINSIENMPKTTLDNNIDNNIGINANPEFKSVNISSLPYLQSEQLYNDVFSKLRFEIHSENVKMIDDVTVEPKNRSAFDKTSLSMIYEYSQERSFGFNLKQETFYLDFTAIADNGKDYKYVMQPNLTGYELFWREKFLTEHALHPYTNLAIGVNEIGMTVKPGFGLEYRPEHNIALILGCELASLFYKKDSNYFGSHKLAVYYGVSIGI